MVTRACESATPARTTSSPASPSAVGPIGVAQPHNLGITPDGRTAYAASQKEGHQALAILDVTSGAERGSGPLDHMPPALNVSPAVEPVFFTYAGVAAVPLLDPATHDTL